ncbi:hypothetical protein [Filimonas effusa]|uniref:DUF4890 domain-containing protein n=1 Tax=Filimonas effusa TaxID=2508721 RepID=A0A4Q1D301_9BACT|nr:hypothetical protein [Filimonas effusa]RXK81445.1 hypothetical protein ESB13_21175 [Filimonas effusa]
MKLFKIAALFICCLMLSVMYVHAQDLGNSTPEERAAMQTEWLKTKLSLSSEQETKVNEINLKYAREMDPVLKGSGGKLAKLKKAKAINDKKEAEYKTVFSSEQFATYQKLKSDMKDQMKAKMKERKNG